MSIKLTKNLLPLYREAYRTDWPKHNIAFILLDNFVKRIEKYPDWDFNKVKFYGSEAQKDATFVYDDGIFIFFDSLSNDVKVIKEILSQLDYKNNKMFIVREEFMDLVNDVLESNSLEIIFEHKSRAIYNEIVDVPILKEIASRVPEEFYMDDLKEKDVKLLTEKWPYSKFLVDPQDMFRKCIKYNPSTGLYLKKDDRLIAWTSVYEFGMSGNLYVEKEFRKRKLGSYVIASQCLKIINEGKLINGAIPHDNKTSIEFSQSFGATVVGNVNWIHVRKLLGKL